MVSLSSCLPLLDVVVDGVMVVAHWTNRRPSSRRIITTGTVKPNCCASFLGSCIIYGQTSSPPPLPVVDVAFPTITPMHREVVAVEEEGLEELKLDGCCCWDDTIPAR